MMVDLQNLKNAISGGPYSEQGKAVMLAIVDAAIAKGTMTSDEKQKLLNIIDLEIDQKDLEIKANDKVAEMLETYAAAVDSATQTASDNLDEAVEEEKVQVPEVAQGVPAGPQVPAEASQTETPQAPVPPTTPPWTPPTQ